MGGQHAATEAAVLPGSAGITITMMQIVGGPRRPFGGIGGKELEENGFGVVLD